MNSKLHSNASKCREHSRKSRDSGKPTDGKMPGKLVKRTFIRDMHLQHSECREHSQNSWIKQVAGVEVTVSSEDAKCPASNSDFPKDSQNSLLKGETNVDPREAKATFGDREGQWLVTVSEFREFSPNSWVVMEGLGDKQNKQHTTPVCIGESSEYSRDSLHVGNNV